MHSSDERRDNERNSRSVFLLVYASSKSAAEKSVVSECKMSQHLAPHEVKMYLLKRQDQ